MKEKCYWLFSCQVVTRHQRNGQENTKRFNVLVTTDHPRVTRFDLAKAQEGASHRFVNEATQIPGFQIVDVYIEAFSLLGEMTEEEWNAGFSQSTEAKGKMN